MQRFAEQPDQRPSGDELSREPLFVSLGEHTVSHMLHRRVMPLGNTFLNFEDHEGDQLSADHQVRPERHSFGAFGARGNSFQRDFQGGFLLCGDVPVLSEHSSLAVDGSEDSARLLTLQGGSQRGSFQCDSGSFQGISEREGFGLDEAKEVTNDGCRKGSFHLQTRAVIDEESEVLDELMGDLPEAPLPGRAQNILECRTSNNGILARILNRKNLKSQDGKMLSKGLTEPDRQAPQHDVTERRSFQRDSQERRSFQRDAPERGSFQRDTPARISHQDLSISGEGRDYSWSRMTYSSFDATENLMDPSSLAVLGDLRLDSPSEEGAKVSSERPSLDGTGEVGMCTSRTVPARTSHSDPFAGEGKFTWQTFSSMSEADDAWMPSMQSDALTQALMGPRGPAQETRKTATGAAAAMAAGTAPSARAVPTVLGATGRAEEREYTETSSVKELPCQVRQMAPTGQMGQGPNPLSSVGLGMQLAGQVMMAPLLGAVGPLVAIQAGIEIGSRMPMGMPPMTSLPALSGMGWAPLPLTAPMAMLAEAQRKAMLMQAAQADASTLMPASGPRPVGRQASMATAQWQGHQEMNGAWLLQSGTMPTAAHLSGTGATPATDAFTGTAVAGTNGKSRKAEAATNRAPKTSPGSTGVVERVASGEVRTLMVRNIPVRYTQDMLLKEWPSQGSYDFLYLPICIDRKRNASFAFVNFTSAEAALAFQARWQKQRLEQYSSRKSLDISPADVQGRDENLLQIVRNKTFRIRNLHFQPAIFIGSERISMEDFLVSMNWQSKGAKLQASRDEGKELASTVSEGSAGGERATQS